MTEALICGRGEVVLALPTPARRGDPGERLLDLRVTLRELADALELPTERVAEALRRFGVDEAGEVGELQDDGPFPALVPVGARPASQDPALVYLTGLQSHESRRTQGSALREIARALGLELAEVPWHRLTYAHTSAIRSLLTASLAPATAARYLSALRSVLKIAWKLGQMSLEALHRASAWDKVRGTRIPPGRELRDVEVRELVSAAKKDPRRRRGARAGALVAVCFGAGLRRHEAAKLDVSAYDGKAVRIVGKGNVERKVPLPEGARRLLEAWLEVRGRAPGPLLSPLSRRGRSRLTADGVGRALKRLGRRARVKGFSPHDLRRSAITKMLRAGADVLAVKKFAGHANLATTERYDCRGEEAVALAAELLQVPS